jgi:MoaA/NifB/PqqE/SkfB family radical SAM enzyme
MPFCYAPWTNIDVSPQGDLTPCCKFQTSHYDQKFKVQTNDLDDYLSSDFLKEVKQDFLQQQWPKGCKRCQAEEQHGIKSKRQLDSEMLDKHYADYDLDSNTTLTASVAFGNTCNLKCVTCGSYASSKWKAEYSEIAGINFDHVQFYKKDFANKFVEKFPHIIHLDVPGGEPLLSGVDEQKKILELYIKSGQSSLMNLHYTTNASIFPDQDWWDLWKEFANVDIQISVDGVNQRYEYIRFPASWEQLNSSVDQYLEKKQHMPNLQLSVCHTVSIYNIYYIDEFLKWCYSKKLFNPWLNKVHTPPHLRPTVWPKETRLAIADHLRQSRYKNMKSWITLLESGDDSVHFELFKERLKKHDEYRGVDFCKTFPELAPFIK